MPEATAGATSGDPTGQRVGDPADPGGGNLAGGVLSTGEVLAQSVANIAPTYSAAIVVALISGVAGNGAWVTWALATTVFILVGFCVVSFARRYASSGSLYSFMSIGLGPRSAFVVGASWIAIVATGPVIALVFGSYAISLLAEIGISVNDPGRLVVYLVGVGSAAFISFRGIELSTRLLLIFEFISMALIVFLLVVVVIDQGSPFDSAQLTLEGASFENILRAFVLAAFAFGGFESAASLGLEAKEPRRQIPVAVLGAALLVGLFFIFNAYAQSYGFSGREELLAESTAPLSDLAGFVGLGGLRFFIDAGIVIGTWACMLANFNHGSRLLFTLSNDRILPGALRRAHPVHKTPYVAVAAFTTIWSAFLVVIVMTAGDVNQWIGYLGSFQGYLYMLGYALVGVAAAAAALRATGRNPLQLLAGLLGAGALLVVLQRSVTPMPESPMNIVFYAFIGYVVLALAYYSVRSWRDPELPERVRRSAHDGKV